MSDRPAPSATVRRAGAADRRESVPSGGARCDPGFVDGAASTVPSTPPQQPETGPPDPLPGHVAIVMDGNGRWAAARGLPRSAGHRRGADAVRQVVRAARELGIPALTLYAFSAQNWGRPA